MNENELKITRNRTQKKNAKKERLFVNESPFSISSKIRPPIPRNIIGNKKREKSIPPKEKKNSGNVPMMPLQLAPRKDLSLSLSLFRRFFAGARFGAVWRLLKLGGGCCCCCCCLCSILTDWRLSSVVCSSSSSSSQVK